MGSTLINPASRPSSSDEKPNYVLGYSEDEFRRLERQAAFLRDLTEDVLRRAGISRGMHVLDLGCGVGDVSLLAADLVGPSGSVLGLDSPSEAVDTTRRRMLGDVHDLRI